MSYTTPDLASILHTLSAFAPAAQSNYYPPAGYPYQEQAPPILEDGELPYEPPYEPEELPYEPAELPYEPPYEPAEIPYETPVLTAAPLQPTATSFSYEPQHPQQSQYQHQTPQQQHPQARPQQPQQPQSDPRLQPTPQQPRKPSLPSASTITTWPRALRHISKMTENPDVEQRIKHLITTQHDHERQWWKQREALLQKQRGREEERRKLDGVLSAVGGHIAPMTHVHDPASEKAELERFDRKVYVACQTMVAATMAELGKLDVPFFALQKDLVGDGEGKVGEEELRALRVRMVGTLEDLCQG